jgi:hypothetical protein
MKSVVFRSVICLALLTLGMTTLTEVTGVSSGAVSLSRHAEAGVTAVTFGAGGTGVYFDPSAASPPAMPTAATATAAWQNWVSQWDASLSTDAITASFNQAGCTVTSDTISPMTVAGAEALGFPQGIDPDGGIIQFNCNKTAASMRRPLTSPGAGSESESVGGPGTQYVWGDCDDAGVDNTVCTSYTYNGSGYIQGHVELSSEGYDAMTCAPGTLIQNQGAGSPGLSNGGEVIAYDPTAPTGSNVYNGNFWQGTSSPYTNEGNACAGI